MTGPARIAGALYLLTNATAVAGFAIRQSLAGADASATARVIDSEWLYRLSVVADIVTVAGVVVLVWALYVLVRPVNRIWRCWRPSFD